MWIDDERRQARPFKGPTWINARYLLFVELTGKIANLVKWKAADDYSLSRLLVGQWNDRRVEGVDTGDYGSKYQQRPLLRRVRQRTVFLSLEAILPGFDSGPRYSGF